MTRSWCFWRARPCRRCSCSGSRAHTSSSAATALPPGGANEGKAATRRLAGRGRARCSVDGRARGAQRVARAWRTDSILGLERARSVGMSEWSGVPSGALCSSLSRGEPARSIFERSTLALPWPRCGTSAMPVSRTLAHTASTASRYGGDFASNETPSMLHSFCGIPSRCSRGDVGFSCLGSMATRSSSLPPAGRATVRLKWMHVALPSEPPRVGASTIVGGS
eukprot:5885070-Prymnesium_polylepis.1